MIFSMWGFVENAKSGNINKEGWKAFEDNIRRLCKLADIDYDMDVAFQLAWAEKKRKYK